MRAVDAFFSEHDRNVRTGNAGYVGVIVDRTTDFILDDVACFSLCSDLLTGDRNTADTLGSTFHQAVDVGLTHVTDNHQVVCTMPCAHTHSSDIIFEPAGCDLSCDDRHRLRVDVFKVF